MTSAPVSRSRLAVAAVLVVLVAGLGIGLYLWRRPKDADLPPPGSPRYEEYAAAFQLGTAALDADLYDKAHTNLSRAIELVPEEPAAWANRGLLYLRDNKVDDAARDVHKAHELAPDNPEIETILAGLAERRGSFDEAVRHLRKALERRPRDLAARYTLAQLIARAAAGDSDTEYQRLMEDILRVQPNNLKVLTERAKAAVRRRDAGALKETLARFATLAPNWAPAAAEQLRLVQKAAEKPLPGGVPAELAILGNLLQAEPGFQRGALAVSASSSGVGEPLEQFVKLAPLRTAPDEADRGLTFTSEAPPGIADEVKRQRWEVVLPVWLTDEGAPALFVANAAEVRRADGKGAVLPFPAGKEKTAPTADGMLALDWNNDARTDLLLAGAGGLKFWKQSDKGDFVDVTDRTGLEAGVLGGDYMGAWAADIEMDGDLDLILAPRTGPPLVLRNNLDGTFKVVKPFAGVENVRVFVWVDLDNDGAPDAVFLDDRGRLHVFSNERSGQFRTRPMPADLGRLAALTAADVNDDGVLDLLGLRGDGAIVRLSDRDRGQSWEVVEIARGPDSPGPRELGRTRLLTADLDNNGRPDLIVAGSLGGVIWLAEKADTFTLHVIESGMRLAAAEDTAGQGRLDLVALTEEGKLVRLVNRGTKEYHWQSVRPFANRKQEVSGDNRINSFGIGGEIEVRAGSLVQKQRITAPRVHFGLGHRRQCEVIRIIWPNGAAQVEFPTAIDQLLVAEQRLKGSCPYLFAWDGRRMSFVTDFLWSTPLGMFINGQEKGGFLQTTDWVKVRGDQLVPREGFYDLRVQANLWETHFFDHLALLVVDHPADTEVFVDERFALTPMTPQVHLTAPPRPIARARDDNGDDVTDIVRAIDGRYLDTFGRGRFQGITRDHWVEVDLGAEAPTEGPLWLLAHGWVHPTDSSINVSVSQGRHEGPRGLVLEVPDGTGGWKVGRDALGFPAGKNKTILIRLDGITGKGVARRFRLRTNMEIYWDALQYAAGLEAKDMRQRRLDPDTAELRYRGILELTQANASSPELPHYDKVAGVSQRWRDLIGYHTRHGDVRELLAQIDDRYAILNAGDEIVLRYRADDGPPAGWKRDFVCISDGWVKDGDLNTRSSRTVLPLPAHDQKSYARAPGRLQDDPVYRRHPDDWRTYHTRYVTPHAFERGLRSFRAPQP
jgi:tetratricopeptide (TPR) repeat protein